MLTESWGNKGMKGRLLVLNLYFHCPREFRGNHIQNFTVLQKIGVSIITKKPTIM